MFADYYPFGMQMPGRTYSAGAYRYGFNGMEKDDEVKGEGNSYDFGARIYDSRIGRWLSLDALESKYVAHSPYNFVFNNPLIYIDLDGNDGIAFLSGFGKKRTLVIRADYHYIEGSFDKTTLEQVKSKYKTVKGKFEFNGEKVKVKFEINFIEEKIGTDLTAFNGSNGQNSLVEGEIRNKTYDNQVEDANYHQVTYDDSKTNRSTTAITDDGVIVERSLSESQAQARKVDAIAHGIAHNLGFIHGDGGLISHLETNIESSPDFINEGKINDVAKYVNNRMFYSNDMQDFISRIIDMTKQGRGYWDRINTKSSDPKDQKPGALKQTGIIIYDKSLNTDSNG